MIDLKPYGAFIENTIRPLIQELREINFPMSEDALLMALSEAARTHVIASLINMIRDISVISIIIWGLWKTSL